MAVFTLATDYLCEMGYPFDNSRQIGNTSYVLIWNGKGFNFEWTIRLTKKEWFSLGLILSVNIDEQFEGGLSVQIARVQPSPPLRKKSEKGCPLGVSVGEGATVHRLGSVG